MIFIVFVRKYLCNLFNEIKIKNHFKQIFNHYFSPKNNISFNRLQNELKINIMR